jgi:hypothetical protein
LSKLFYARSLVKKAPFNYLRKTVNNLFPFPELVEGNITESVDFGGVPFDLFPFPELVEGNITESVDFGGVPFDKLTSTSSLRQAHFDKLTSTSSVNITNSANHSRLLSLSKHVEGKRIS